MLRLAHTAVAVVAATLTLAGPAVAAPGDLDPTFSGDGRLTLALGQYATAGAVAVQPDGRLVVAGGAQTGDEQGVLTVRRLTPKGAPDTSFGGGDGLITLPAPAAPEAAAVVVQPDGRILVGGGCEGASFVVRLRPGGAVDPSWAGGLECGGNGGGVASLALQPDGRVLVGGSFQETAGRLPGYLGRLLGDGTGDPSFEGYQGTNAPPFFWATSGIVVGGDGRIVAADDVVKRLLPDGTPDPAWDLPGTPPLATPLDVAVQGDGRVISVGMDHGAGTAVVERRRAGGALDSSFGSGGRVLVALPGEATASDVRLQLDGRIVVTGAAGRRWMAFRLLPDGRLDPAFGTGGRVTLPLDTWVLDAAVQADGRIVLVGGTTDAAGRTVAAVARLQGDPVPFCAGRRPTITGTGLVLGSTAADVIVTSGGADTVLAGAGDDTVCAGGGGDDVDGGSGADGLYGGAGADRVQGWTGADRLFGEAGDDRLFGQAGDDRLDGGADTDVADGGAGTDTGIRNESQTAIP